MVNMDHGAASIFAIAGSTVSLLAPIPYGLAILRRTVRPHLFTWLIWSIVTTIAAAGQFAAGAGPSAWCTAAIALTCIAIFLASLYRGERSRTKSDWLCLGMALSALPLWILTNEPTLSICLVTFIELAGLGPTIRKIVRDPWGESLAYFMFCVVKYGLAILALAQWTIAVAFYPVVNVMASAGICLLIIVQRYRLRTGNALLR